MSSTTPAAGRQPERDTRRQPRRSLWAHSIGDWWTIALPALIAYVPLLLTRAGEVGADTKTYLYLDPGRLLRDAPYLWDSQIGLGTVTHQNIGYLWPMGPFYWLFDALGLPDWVTQRLWLGSVMFAAALGVRYLIRTLGQHGFADRSGAVLVASLAYMMSPYLLEYEARISVILLPWAALPWLIALTAKALRHGGWRYPAWLALVVLTVGGINATALILVGVGPLLWVVHAVWLEREVPLRDAIRAVVRIGLLTLLTSLWWMAGLWVQGRYGLPVLRYTETYKTVAEVSTAPEVLRGLGYWFFYGNDKLGPWIEPSVTYTQRIPILVLSYAIPVLALTSAALVRWRYRAYFLVLLVAGTLIAVGSHPWEEPSPLGAVFKSFTRTGFGLGMRSTPRAAPLVVLASALFLGAGVAALSRRLPRYAVPVTALVALLVAGNLPTLWTGEMVAANLKRPEEIPSYWLDAIRYLDGQSHDTRILEVPGSDFASYRWGNTVDPITPGLTDRGYVARELFQWGSPPSASLVNAFDRRLHEGDLDPQAVAPFARLIGAGDVVYRADLQFERYRTARPRQTWELLRSAPGLAPPIELGPHTPNIAGPEQPMIDEIELDAVEHLPYPPPVAIFPVKDALPMIRSHRVERPLLVAGDGEGIVDAASIGLLDLNQAILYSAAFAADPDGFNRVLALDADLLVTDTNRKRARRWGTLRETTGYTERAGEKPPRYDPSDQRLALFPDAGDDAYTVSEQRGGAVATATDYGNPVTYTPNDRAANAVDGDPLTAWRVGAVDDPIGERLTIRLDEPVTTGTLTLLQPINLVRNRWITEARLRFDGGDAIDISLDDRSRELPGQVVTFPERTFRELSIEVRATNIPKRPRYDGISGVGFAEVGIPGVRVDELVRPPVDLLQRAGSSSLDHRLTLLFTRLRSNPSEPVRTDEEPALARVVWLPTARAFSLAAQARLSAELPDEVVDRLLGLPDAASGGVTARSSQRLPGSLARRASSAVDGDPTTHWAAPFLDQEGHYLDIETGQPVTFDHLDLQIVADGRHSVPTRLTLTVDGDPAKSFTLDLPVVEDRAESGGVVSQRVDLPVSVTGRSFVIRIDGVRPVETIDWYSNTPITMPVAIAELGIPGVQRPPLPERFDTGCRTDLLTVDGQPVPLRITGSTADALSRKALTVAPCGEGDGAVRLDAGEHVIRSRAGRVSGIDLDRVALASAAGGGPAPVVPASSAAASAPPTHTVSVGPVSFEVEVAANGEPFWLSVGQSWNPGWHATVDGRDLGPPTIIDGYANGWLIEPDDAGPVRITVEWTPQRVVWLFLAISAVAAVATLVLAIGGRRPPRGRRAITEDDPSLDPQLTLPWEQEHERLSPQAALVAAALLSSVSFLNLSFAGWLPALSLLVGGATYAALRAPRGRGWLALGGVGCLAAAYGYIVISQLRHRHVPDFIWPAQFERVHVLGVLAVLLLAAEAVREVALRRRTTRRPTTTPDPAASGDRAPSIG
ncbi:MAG: alpha-(1-_3)-arabinofuranosyltransferase family protein [Acidimicrobiales bacterium]